jgi:molybdopterin-guanine dinucleotide biosynthesis protein A
MVARVPEPAAPPTAAGIAGVVLAGGRGTRMGGLDKGWVPFEGRALVEHALARLAPQVGTVLISASRNLERYETLGWAVVPDAPEHRGRFLGPLAGMLAALRAAPLPWAVFVPCDAPVLPLDLVARLAAAGAGGRAALACCRGQREPVFCLLPRSMAPALAAALEHGERRPGEFLQRMQAVEVAFDDAAAFANINTPAAAAAAAAACAAGIRAAPDRA